jgi:two-component system copper resistance phosphate regulon response regulator CusR
MREGVESAYRYRPGEPPLRILIVDDDPKYLAFVSRGLTESGMVCSTALSGEDALKALRRERFDLVLLDVMLPGLRGWDVLEAMRSEGLDTPVIFVTARDAVDERVRGLRMGGHDYIVKPFAFEELLARIHVALRNRHEQTRLTVGDLSLDLLRSAAERGGRTIPLTRTEYLLLRSLAERSGEAVPRTLLLQTVWGIGFDPGTNIVEVHIRRLRRKVDAPFATPLIHTVRGTGYVLEVRS